MACLTYQRLPMELLTVIQNPAWQGAKLITLKSELARPTAMEISLHYKWMKPWTTVLPTKVPSGYFITDVMLYLHGLLDGQLFRVKESESVRGRAAEEAVRLRKLISSLRYLFRGSD